jgi:hypothetical protein
MARTAKGIRIRDEGIDVGDEIILDFVGTAVVASDSGSGVGTITITGGGGGFTALTATETPNGVLTIFTFAAAAAKPSFIIIDNTITQATTKAGTVNWTWNVGAKQATFTIPPNDDVVGIV